MPLNDIELTGKPVDRGEEILAPQALEFLAHLHRRFAARRDELLVRRAERRARLAAGETLDFLPETRAVREAAWQVAPAPADLADRRVEITGPTERKMAINALNSGAKVWLADLEDASTPTWHNVVAGQVNLFDAVRKQISYTSPEGKRYELASDRPHAVIVMRPRGWHLPERHLEIDGRSAVGALVDFGLYFFHNARELVSRGSGPYFYLPKMESHLEARLWNDVFVEAQAYLEIPRGTVRATVLIETIPAAFEMTEILYELREHVSGLNAGRWDYLFSIIKTFRDAGERFVLPDRDGVSMTVPFMRAYTELLVRTCHERGAFAIGGMAAFIPSRRDPEVNEKALAKVHADKDREAHDGFDGSWVAHPDLVPVCREEFDRVLGDRPNQLGRTREDVHVTADQLLDLAATPGQATEAGLRAAVDIGVRYLVSWLSGTGAAAIHNLMEDAATAEISRSQIWQWTRNSVRLAGGETVTPELVRGVLAELRATLADEAGSDDAQLAHLDAACELFEQIALGEEFVDFLTLPAYDRID
jgi:malate synthase